MTRARWFALLGAPLVALVVPRWCDAPAHAFPFVKPSAVHLTNAVATITSTEAVGTNGGTLNIGVTNLKPAYGADAGMPQVWVQTGGPAGAGGVCGFGGGVWTQLTGVGFVSSTNLIATLPAGTYTAGLFNMLILSNDGQVVCGANLFNITSIQTPPQIMSGCSGTLIYASGCTGGSGSITSCPDTFGGTAYPLNVIGNGGGTINTADSSFRMSNVTTVTTNGTNQYLCTSGSVAWAATSQTVMIDVVAYSATGQGFLSAVAEYEASSSNFFYIAHGGNDSQYYGAIGGAGTALTVAQTSPSPNTLIGWDTYVGSSSATAGITANNQPTVTGSSTTPLLAADGRLCVGATWSGGTPGNFAKTSWAMLFAANCTPTSTQVQQLTLYNGDTFGPTQPPIVSFATEIPSVAGAASRLTGSGFMSGVVFTAVCTGADGGITNYPATTVSVGTYGTTTYADVTWASALPIGTCDVNAANLDGVKRTMNDGLTIKAANADPFVCAMACFGTSVIGLYAQPSSTCTVNTTTSPCTGSNVCCSSWLDQSGLANNESNATASEMMVLKSADGTFGSTYSYLKGNGSSDCLFTGNSANVHYDTTGTPSPYMSIVTQVPASNNGSAGSFGESSDNIQIGKFASSDPSTVYTGGTASWGSTVSGVRNVMSGATANPDGGPPTLSISDSNGTPVTATSTGVHPVTTAAWFVGSDVNAVFFYSGPVAAQVVLNAPPTQTDAGAATGTGCWESCAQSLLGANQIAANDSGLAKVPPVGGFAALGALGALALLLRRRRTDQEAA